MWGSHLEPSFTPSCRLFAYKVSPDLKMPQRRRISPQKFLSSAATKNPNSEDGSSCSGTLPGLGIAPEAIFIVVAASHDAPGVVLHRGWGLYLRLCGYLSLSPMVWSLCDDEHCKINEFTVWSWATSLLHDVRGSVLCVQLCYYYWESTLVKVGSLGLVSKHWITV